MVSKMVGSRVSFLVLLVVSAAGCGGGNGQPASGGGGSSGAGGAGTSGTGGAGDTTDGGMDKGPPVIQTVIVDAPANNLALSTCGVTPALFTDVPAGTYTIALAASTLSKGTAGGSPAVDDYVIVHLPLPPGDPNEVQRFFMLHSVGATASVTLPATGSIELMFIDSDSLANSGQATVTLEPGGYTATVDAVTNVLRWTDGCHSDPATLTVSNVPHRATLVASSLSAGPGSTDNFVIVRLPLDGPVEPYRYVILNGIGASQDFTPFNNMVVSAWFIGATTGATGSATINITDL